MLEYKTVFEKKQPFAHTHTHTQRSILAFNVHTKPVSKQTEICRLFHTKVEMSHLQILIYKLNRTKSTLILAYENFIVMNVHFCLQVHTNK